jgi:tetratricopeptide (TPR) repeat protein
MVFIANVYSWQEKNDSALIYINKAQAINYKKDELYETWTNILMRMHRYDELIKSCLLAQKKKYANNEDLVRKQIIAYTELGQYENGIKLMDIR